MGDGLFFLFLKQANSIFTNQVQNRHIMTFSCYQEKSCNSNKNVSIYICDYYFIRLRFGGMERIYRLFLYILQYNKSLQKTKSDQIGIILLNLWFQATYSGNGLIDLRVNNKDKSHIFFSRVCDIKRKMLLLYLS